MIEFEEEIKDMVEAKKILIALVYAIRPVADYDDYQAINVMMEKCDNRSREARRKLRHANCTNNKGAQ